MNVKVGTILIHPVHGEMKVIDIKESNGEEYISGEWRPGKTIKCIFDRFIPSVQWRLGSGNSTVSMLIFHEYYLSKLKVKN